MCRPKTTEEFKRTFQWTYTDEPHATRRNQILKKHPEILQLRGPEWRTKYIIAGMVAAQIGLAYLTLHLAWYWKALVVYVLGATLTHSLFLGIHEVSHGLAFRKPWKTTALMMVANLPVGLPYCMSFQAYHQDHHKYQGEDVIDTDVPHEFEVKVFRGTLGKLVWCTCQILFYAVRPLFIRPLPPDAYLALNWAVQFTFDAVMVYFFGAWPIVYFLLCDFFAGSLHPMAGHFIAEHYTFVKNQETYSYYGPLNMLAFNVGYHNEHHDFPFLAWTQLPKVRQIAHEFYDDLPTHDSWTMVLVKYILDPEMGPFSRIKRPTGSHRANQKKRHLYASNRSADAAPAADAAAAATANANANSNGNGNGTTHTHSD